MAEHTTTEWMMKQATLDDVGAIRSLTREAYAKWIPLIGREPLPMAVDYNKAIQNHRFDLMFMGNTLAGLIETVSEIDHIFIENLAVSSAFQRQGLGRDLLGHVEEIAQSKTHKTIKLLTNKEFAGNVSFYQKAGFHIEREEEFMNGISVHMKKTIAP